MAESNAAQQPSIVFFGTGPVAAASLRLLHKSFAIEAVITKPRPAHHRGPVPVLELAEELGLGTLTAANKVELSAVITKQQFSSQLAVLIDFGIIVRQDVIDKFPLGIVNSHFSLLPQWRGADPLTFAILSGQPKTGVSLMLLVEAMDEGPLLGQAEYHIKADETTASLTDQLIKISAQSLESTLPQYIAGHKLAYPQTDSLSNVKTPTYSRKLSKDDGQLDFNKTATKLEREIRAYSQWPKSFTQIAGKPVVITSATISSKQVGNPADVLVEDKNIYIQTKDGSLQILRLKPAGKAEMTAQEFLAGYGKLL